MPGGYFREDAVVSQIDWKGAQGSAAKGDVGTVIGLAWRLTTLQAAERRLAFARCLLEGSGFPDDSPLVELEALVDVAPKIGHRAVKADTLEVEFHGVSSLNMTLRQITRQGEGELPGKYWRGDAVVSHIDWTGKQGSVAKGDVGTVIGLGNRADKLLVDFPGISGGLNVLLRQVERG